MKLEIDSNIFNNNIIFSIFGAFINVFILFIEKCICFKKDTEINYISYIKIFIITFIILYSILYLKDQCNHSNIYDDISINTNDAEF